MSKLKAFWEWLLRTSLWLVAVGIMIASSGIDGAYMDKLNAWPWFGYILNTVSDIASVALMYWYGRLQQDKSKTKREKSKGVLASEIIAVAYSWLFSWRQLRGMTYQAEPDPLVAKLGANPIASIIEIELLAFAFAGFAPLMLAFIGLVQSLLAGRIEGESEGRQTESRAQAKTELSEPFHCPLCDRSFSSQAALNGHQSAHKANGNGHKLPESEPIATGSEQ